MYICIWHIYIWPEATSLSSSRSALHPTITRTQSVPELQIAGFSFVFVFVFVSVFVLLCNQPLLVHSLSLHFHDNQLSTNLYYFSCTLQKCKNIFTFISILELLPPIGKTVKGPFLGEIMNGKMNAVNPGYTGTSAKTLLLHSRKKCEDEWC